MRKLSPKEKKQQEIEDKQCFQCGNMHNPFNIGASGEFIMAHCTNKMGAILLSSKACLKFTPL